MLSVVKNVGLVPEFFGSNLLAAISYSVLALEINSSNFSLFVSFFSLILLALMKNLMLLRLILPIANWPIRITVLSGPRTISFTVNDTISFLLTSFFLLSLLSAESGLNWVSYILPLHILRCHLSLMLLLHSPTNS